MSLRTRTGIRLTHLAACLSAALNVGVASASPYPETAKNSAVIRSVMSCADDGSAGTLRSEIASAPDGATIDLSGLACSTITLSDTWATPYLDVMQNSLYLKGPSDRHLTIDGAHHASVLRHSGSGMLGLTDLRVANGYSVNNADPLAGNGGCIYSNADVDLTRSSVSDCSAISVIDGVRARGGGIYTKGVLTLSSSDLARNRAITTGSVGADGGGAFAVGGFEILYSSVIDNAANDKYAGSYSLAGGIHGFGNATISGSTIANNTADVAGGVALSGLASNMAEVTNSTVSGNTARQKFGGIWSAVPLSLWNTTIAFNHARASGGARGAGLFFTTSLLTRSSIIADNASELGPSDLGQEPTGALVAQSDNNLIVETSLQLPVGTIRDCPRLQPLGGNGGATATLALGQGSPAIDRGNNARGLTTDQRFVQRVIGADADIGAYERQPAETDERIFADGFDSLCDQ